MEELFEADSFRPEGLRSVADGRWVVLGRLQITEKESGDELDVPLAHVLEQRDRKVASFTAYSEISAALESVGCRSETASFGAFLRHGTQRRRDRGLGTGTRVRLGANAPGIGATRTTAQTGPT